MKITNIEVYLGRAITIKMNTDEGISGFGEAGLEYGCSREAAFGQCIDFAGKVIGMDPFNIEAVWEHLHRNTFWGMGGGIVVSAGMAAIDIACWDIKGKALGLPVYQLLGGKTNPKLRAYASQLQFGWRKMQHETGSEGLLYKPEEYYDVVKEVAAEGFDAVKIDPIFVPSKPIDRQELFSTMGMQYRGSMRRADVKLAAERIAAAREAGGDNMDIIVEVHSLLDTNTSVALGQAIEPYGIMYYEEPTMPDNPANYRFIDRHCGIPLATGERSSTRWGFRQFFEDRTLSIIQPDLCNTGGITEVKKICDMAQVYDMGVQLHVCGGPIATAAALHVETVIPNFVIHELHTGSLVPERVAAGKYDYQATDGCFVVPELPGIGQEMSDEEMLSAKKYVVE